MKPFVVPYIRDDQSQYLFPPFVLLGYKIIGNKLTLQ